MIIHHPVHQIFCSFPAITGPVICSPWDVSRKVSRKEGSPLSISRTRSPAIVTPYGAGSFLSGIDHTQIFVNLGQPTLTQMKESTTIVARIVLTPHIAKGDSGVSGISGEFLGSLTRAPASLGAGSKMARCGSPWRVDLF